MAPDNHAPQTTSTNSHQSAVIQSETAAHTDTQNSIAAQASTRDESWWRSRIDALATAFDLAIGSALLGLGVCVSGWRIGSGLGFIGIGLSSFIGRKRAAARADVNARIHARRDTFLDDMCRHQNLTPHDYGVQTYECFAFRLRGLPDYGVIDVSLPLCTTCQSPMVQRAQVRFPFSSRVEFRCERGHLAYSIKTGQELAREFQSIVFERQRIAKRPMRQS